MFKTSQHVEIGCFGFDGSEKWEAAQIVRVRASMKPMPEGYHPVRFADGGVLCVHETRMRVANWWLG